MKSSVFPPLKSSTFCYVICSLVVLLSCVKEDCQEERKDSCVVTFELNWVCGCNGVSYENPSKAACNGISYYTMGKCK